MKNLLTTLIISLSILVGADPVVAQTKGLKDKQLSALLSDKGHWVIESNIKTPKSSIVHFYNIDNTLMYSEKVEGIELNLEKRKTVRLLNRALLQTLLTWNNEKQKKQSEQLVKNMFRE